MRFRLHRRSAWGPCPGTARNDVPSHTIIRHLKTINPSSAARPYALALLRKASRAKLAEIEPEEDSLLAQWLASFEQEGATGRWLTWHHLIIDYQMCTGSVGPWKKPGSRRWQRGAGWSSQLQDYPLQPSARALSRFVMQHAKSLEDIPQTVFRQPDGATYAQWAACLWLPLSLQRWERIEAFLRDHSLCSKMASRSTIAEQKQETL